MRNVESAPSSARIWPEVCLPSGKGSFRAEYLEWVCCVKLYQERETFNLLHGTLK